MRNSGLGVRRIADRALPSAAPLHRVSPAPVLESSSPDESSPDDRARVPLTDSVLQRTMPFGLGVRQSIYLRTVGGELIGPIGAEASAALLETGVIGPETPASRDGRVFSTLRALEQTSHASHTDASHTDASHTDVSHTDVSHTDVSHTDTHPRDDATTSTIDLGTTVLRGILERAMNQASGYVRVAATCGDITLAMKDGKVVEVRTSVEDLDLPQFLERNHIVSPADLREASVLASASQADLGATLISLGRIAPHVYAEALLAWAMKVMASALLEQHRHTLFEAAEVGNPAIPIALDRLGVFMDAVRAGMSLEDLDAYARPHLRRPVIPAAGDGLTTEAFKLKPRELRVMNSVDGLRTVQDLIAQLGKTPESRLAVLQVLFFAEQAGLIVYGEDRTKAEMAQRTKELRAKRAELEALNFMQILEVSADSSDAAVRSHYAELVKRYHPDRLPPDAPPELIDAQRSVFELIQESFNELETESGRVAYAANVTDRTASGANEQQRVQDVLRAEVIFKKALILVRVRKYGEALAHIDEAITLNATEPEFRVYRPYVEYLNATQGRRDPQLAERHRLEIAPLLEKHPASALGHLCMGLLYRQGNDDARALRCFEKVLEFDAQQPEALDQVRLLTRRVRDTKDAKKRRS
ncbi:MAG: DnaJ domain-containing protein [Deltaproteobacteria bacterium]|nr:DnaJ domain-containing protein [Deltaproteobacteria bacterium]